MPLRTPGVLSQISINITVFVVLATLVFLVLTLYFMLPPVHRPHLTFVAALIGGAATLYGAYYAGTTLRTNLRRDQQRRSFELLDSLNRLEYVTVRIFIEQEIVNQRIPPEEMREKILKNQQLYEKVILLLGFFEDVSIAVQEGFADEMILRQSIKYMSLTFPLSDLKKISCGFWRMTP